MYLKRRKKHHHAYLKVFLPFALFSSLCILVFAVVISLILSADMKEAYFDSEFYRFVANAVSIALIIFSVSFFFSCVLAYRPVKMIMDDNEDLSAAEKAAKTELIKKFLYELCVYGKSECELSHLPLKEYLPLDLLTPLGLSLVFIDRYRIFFQKTPSQQLELLSTVEAIITDEMQELYREITIISPDRKYVIVIYNTKPETGKETLQRLFISAQSKILQATGFTVTIVSQPESVTIEHLDIIYKECMQGIHQRLFTGWNSLIQIQAESDAMLFSQSEFIEELKKLNDHLIHGSLEQPDAFSNLLKQYTGDWLAYQTALLSVRSQLEQDLLVLENSKKMAYHEAMREHLIFDNCETTEEIDALLLQTVQFIKKKYEHADQQRQQGYIDEVERLIEKNYQNCDYGVLQIATDLNLSNTYISKLYKDLTGTNIIERLTQYRMKAAVSLLLETDIPVTDIYSLAGYSSVNYFYRVFKKYYGVTPGQYRDMKGDSQ